MKKIKYTKSGLAGKGFYIALALSLLAVAVTTIIAINRSVTQSDTKHEMSAQPFSSDAAPINNNQSDVAKQKSSQSSSSKQSSQAQKSSTPSAQTNKKAAVLKFYMPVTGEIIKEFSNGELVKSETMGDWRTHDGIDIAAKQSTPVKSAADGTICDITNDNMWGTCITIDHGNQMKSYYYGLNETVQVKLDDVVKAGDVIGSVGVSNQLESALPEHLHFGMKKDGVWVNPLDYLK